jgi:hypothetical protein
MASKAGKAQFKDIKVGRTLWAVLAGVTHRGDLQYGWAHEPERVVVVEKPFRTQIAHITGRRRDEWSFTVHYSEQWWDPSTMTVYDCSEWGIETDIPFKGLFGLRFMFTTKAHAVRYVDRVRHDRLRDIYEHPKQFTRLGFMSKPADRKRVQKMIRPYQFVVGGVVCDHTTPKASIEYYVEQSTRELSMMYPYEIKPIVFTEEMLKKWALDPEAFKQTDPKKFYPGTVLIPDTFLTDSVKRALIEKDFVILDEAHPLDVQGKWLLGYDPAGPSLSSIMIGNGDQVTHAEVFPKKN